MIHLIAAIVSGYIGVDVRLKQSDFSLRVTLVQRYLHRKPQVKLMFRLKGMAKLLKPWCTDPVAADRGEDQWVSLLTVPVELDTEERLTVVLLQRPR